MKELKKSFRDVYQKVSFSALTLSLFFVFLFLDYFLLTRVTSFERFLVDNNRLFVFLTIVFSILNNFLIAIALTFLIYLVEKNKN